MQIISILNADRGIDNYPLIEYQLKTSVKGISGIHNMD
jgi:hypothetical protein